MSLRRVLSLFVICCLAVALAAVGAGRKTLRLSGGVAMQADGPSGDMVDPPALSYDGEVSAFVSEATNLEVPAAYVVSVSVPLPDTNGAQDVFAHDLSTGLTVRASVGLGGAPANGSSRHPVLSADGRFIAFESDASNLVLDDTNGMTDVFQRDLLTGLTVRVSSTQSGAQPDGPSRAPSISGDGATIAFESDATNIVPADDNGTTDVFSLTMLRTVPVSQQIPLNGVRRRLSVAAGGGDADGPSRAPSITFDGVSIAFESEATNIVAGDDNGARDVFVRSLIENTTQLVSVGVTGASANGASGHASISASRIAFESLASNIVQDDFNPGSDVFVRDLLEARTRLVSRSPGSAGAPGKSFAPEISADGHRVAFESDAPLDPRDQHQGLDVYLVDVDAGTLEVLTATSKAPDGSSYAPAISGDGLVVAFASDATVLVADDSNGVRDVFARVDETVCSGGAKEAGVVSGPIHGSVEPLAGRAETLAHRVNCALVVPKGL